MVCRDVGHNAGFINVSVFRFAVNFVGNFQKFAVYTKASAVVDKGKDLRFDKGRAGFCARVIVHRNVVEKGNDSARKRGRLFADKEGVGIQRISELLVFRHHEKHIVFCVEDRHYVASRDNVGNIQKVID